MGVCESCGRPMGIPKSWANICYDCSEAGVSRFAVFVKGKPVGVWAKSLKEAEKKARKEALV